jgi:hypothetical protein
MILYAVLINGRLSGDGEMVFLWKKKMDAEAYTIFLHAGEVVKVTISPPADDAGGER